MFPPMTRTTWGPAVASVAAACACGSLERQAEQTEQTEPADHERRIVATACSERRIGWGDGPDQLGFVPGGVEWLARGPQAIAVTAAGGVLVLDSVNGRVVASDERGGARVLADGLPADVEDLAVAADDGAFAVYSPLYATAWVFDADGTPAGGVALDRALRDVGGIALGRSRQVLVRTALQETFDAGSPAAPVALATSLLGKREGAFVLADGRGLATRAAGGASELLVIDNRRGRRATPRAVHAIPGAADAAQLVATTDTSRAIACVRAEHVTQPGERIEVTRRVVCLDVTTGAVVIDRALAAPGPYVPARELALGGNRLAILEPTPQHLTIRTCEVSR
jgi:hypothetical protein